ncbi:sigma-54 dependent transcriptional regulator [Halodesulfovibrio marinisediminis]|uniref:DNA-binding transcriptional response regulator, NtrC family, contains REC, AAA-type ATPase, and a Fis-type DNA-binding domains n=1 Tax=Halodesulfovibrio marinisediminis DSM 17456 TaxID=1121457 RepID=A0A1N6EBI7_9BACT|nr:sigma-54 dependent transcriptional regulator [Halodesulfovibrio marinisediminis]SIN80384.1 DNA-binding transcriptional response regulator, NtrC family, contains REC, AAA-type ATPase, and a Fis-type DNA-binding domains [Halodesulfovibrio marinisediminis DSM 17456]
MSQYQIITPDVEASEILKRSILVVQPNVTLSTVSELKGDVINSQVDVVFVDHGLLLGGKVDISEGLNFIWNSAPNADVVILVNSTEIRYAIEGINAGAVDYLAYPLMQSEVTLVLSRLDRELARKNELSYLHDDFWNETALQLVKTSSPLMREVFSMVRQMAATKTTVLLTGETGIGKSVLAKLIHSHSTRKDKPFVSLHCGAIPDSLIESELFGHTRGAFTGALKDTIGKFGAAEGGTLFLDEIGTITPSMQVKLLHVLQEHTIQRVGSDKEHVVDVRIIAATNDDLWAQCEKGTFRKDLYYRLNVFPIPIPPLRDRKEDLASFAKTFIQNCNLVLGKDVVGLHPKVLAAFKRYSWPGNVRELENIIERACILETEKVIRLENIPNEISALSSATLDTQADISIPLGEARQNVIDQFEYIYLTELLQATKGRINQAAEQAGITTRQIHKLMQKHKLKKEDFK